MIGLVRSTVSPSSSNMRRSTPWVDGCWGPHVDDHRPVVSALDVDVGRVDVAALGQSEDCADLAAQLAGAGGVPGADLLGPLRGLGLEVAVLLGLPVGTLGLLEAEVARVRRPDLGIALVLVVGHRGPGASLNCTGTRPTP